MSVDDIIDKFLSTTKFSTGAPSSYFSWENSTIANLVFERLKNSTNGDNFELCALVQNYLETIGVNSNISADALQNANSVFWFEMLESMHWLGDFNYDRLRATSDLDEIVRTWQTRNSCSFRDFFNLMCLLQTAKKDMIEKAVEMTAGELILHDMDLHDMDNYTPNDVVDEIVNEFVDNLFNEPGHVFAGGVYWQNIQRMILTNWHVFPGDGRLSERIRGREQPGLVKLYLEGFYSTLILYSTDVEPDPFNFPIGSLHKALWFDPDFTTHMVGVDSDNYQHIPEGFRTQTLADIASKKESSFKLIEPAFRGSIKYMIAAFKFDMVDNLPESAPFLNEGVDSADGDRLFENILLVAGTNGSIASGEEPVWTAPAWTAWFNRQISKLRESPFERHAAVMKANPNAVVFFNDVDFITSAWDPSIVENSLVVEALRDVLLSPKEYRLGKGLFAVNVSLPESKANRLISDTTYLTNDAIGAVFSIMTMMADHFEIRVVLPNIFKLVDDGDVDDGSMLRVMNETQFHTLEFYEKNKIYNSEDGHVFDYGRLIDIYDRGWLAREVFINIFAEYIRKGGNYSWFNDLVEDGEIFSSDEVSLLFAARRFDDEDYKRTTFQMLYLAMGRSPVDVAHAISNSVVLVAPEDDTIAVPGAMAISGDDFSKLSDYYFELTGKRL